MSLTVPTAVLDAAERGPIDDAVFLDVIRTSLPYARDVVAAAAADRASERPFGEHEVPPPSEAERGQLLRALASNAIRGDDVPGVGQGHADDVEEDGVVDRAALGGVEDGGGDGERHGRTSGTQAGTKSGSIWAMRSTPAHAVALARCMATVVRW